MTHPSIVIILKQYGGTLFVRFVVLIIGGTELEILKCTNNDMLSWIHLMSIR